MRQVDIVTGAAGFIGSHLSEVLIARGSHVIGVDNLAVGQMQNIAHLLGDNFSFFNRDIREIEDIELSQMRTENLRIFHLAALADIVPSIEQPQDYFESNVRGTLKVLELARKLKAKKFIYAASSSCYGIPRNFPTSEFEQISTEYPYALSKFLGEQLVLHWNKVYKIPSISLRLFNVYGPRARTSGTYGAVFGVFLAQKLAGQPLTIVGDGNQTRDFTHVSDVVRAFVMAGDSSFEEEVFNVGSGNTYSVNHLAKLIGGDTTHIPKRPAEPDCTFADITKIKNILGWKPCVTFESGVSEMLSQIETWRNAPVWTPEKIEIQTRLWFNLLSRSKEN